MTLDINKFDIAKFKVLNKLNFYIVFILSMSFIIYCSYKNTLGVGDFTISLLSNFLFISSDSSFLIILIFALGRL